MTLKLNQVLIGSVLILAVAFGMIALFSPRQDAHANIYTATNIQAATSSAAVAVTAGTRVLATTTSIVGGASYTRVYARICNPTPIPVYLNMNNDKVANASSSALAIIGVAAGLQACFEISENNLYQGSVQASSTNAQSVSVLVSEYVQQ